MKGLLTSCGQVTLLGLGDHFYHLTGVANLVAAIVFLAAALIWCYAEGYGDGINA
jgi:hypothetical protein